MGQAKGIYTVGGSVRWITYSKEYLFWQERRKWFGRERERESFVVRTRLGTQSFGFSFDVGNHEAHSPGAEKIFGFIVREGGTGREKRYLEREGPRKKESGMRSIHPVVGSKRHKNWRALSPDWGSLDSVWKERWGGDGSRGAAQSSTRVGSVHTRIQCLTEKEEEADEEKEQRVPDLIFKCKQIYIVAKGPPDSIGLWLHSLSQSVSQSVKRANRNNHLSQLRETDVDVTRYNMYVYLLRSVACVRGFRRISLFFFFVYPWPSSGSLFLDNCFSFVPRKHMYTEFSDSGINRNARIFENIFCPRPGDAYTI